MKKIETIEEALKYVSPDFFTVTFDKRPGDKTREVTKTNLKDTSSGWVWNRIENQIYNLSLIMRNADSTKTLERSTAFVALVTPKERVVVTFPECDQQINTIHNPPSYQFAPPTLTLYLNTYCIICDTFNPREAVHGIYGVLKKNKLIFNEYDLNNLF